MIYTITFNPSLDYAIEIDELRPYSFQRASGTKIAPGGKGINTAIVLNRLGVDVIAIGFLGGHTGAVILNELQKEGVITHFVPINEMNRINLKFYHAERKTTSVNTPGPYISKSELDDLYRRLDEIEAGSYVVFSGALAQGIPENTYATLMRYLRSKKVKIIVDAEAHYLKPAMQEHPFLIKPNLTEFEDYFGLSSGVTKNYKEKDFAPYLRRLIDDGAENVALTLGEKGAILMDKNYNLYFERSPYVNVVSSVGAGDSFVAGFLASYSKDEDLAAALKFGVVCGAAAASVLFQATKEDVEKLL